MTDVVATSRVSRSASLPMHSAASSANAGKVQENDPTPHGLPIRFSNLSVPSEQSAQAGNEALVATLSSALLDVASLGPLRRAIESATTKRLTDRRKHKYAVKDIDGVVEQVSHLNISQKSSLRHLSEQRIML